MMKIEIRGKEADREMKVGRFLWWQLGLVVKQKVIDGDGGGGKLLMVLLGCAQKGRRG